MFARLLRLFKVESMIKPDLVQGELPTTKQAYKDVLQIALPSIMELVLISLINSMDTMMVGTCGDAAIAAVGLVGQPRMLLMALFFALYIGVTALVARRKGEGRQDDANLVMRNALVIILILSVVIMLVAIQFSKDLMWLAGAKEDTIEQANIYFCILTAVLPVNAMTLCINAALRGIGNTRTTLKVNLTSNIVNIIFNYLLIGGNLGFPRLGVTGAAIATAIGIVFGFFLCIIAIIPHKGSDQFLKLSRHDKWKLDKTTVKSIFSVGGNAMIEQAALRFGFFTYARICAGLGTDPFAAHQIACQFLNLTFSFADGIGVAGTSLVGQNLGKKRPDLSMLYGRVSQRMAIIVSMTLFSLLIIFRYQLVGLYTQTPHVVEMAAMLMIMVAIFQPLQTSSVVISGCLRGAGDTKFVAMVMIMCVSIIRPILAYSSVYLLNLGLMGAWSASIIDMTIRLTCVNKRFNSGKWTSIKV